MKKQRTSVCKECESSGWKQIGVVGVDSGQLLVCDPCYIDGEWKDEDFEMPEEEIVYPDGKVEPIIRCSKKWFELIDRINSGKLKLMEGKQKPAKYNFSYNACAKKTLGNDDDGQLNFEMGHAGVGVVFRSGFGDGVYPVYAREEDGRVAEVRIVMIPHPVLGDKDGFKKWLKGCAKKREV